MSSNILPTLRPTTAGVRWANLEGIRLLGLLKGKEEYIWVPFAWIQRPLKVWGPSGTLAKEQGSPELVSDYGAQRGPFLRPRCIRTIRARTQTLINQSNCQIHIN